MKEFTQWFNQVVKAENERDLENKGVEGIYGFDETQSEALKSAVKRSGGLIIAFVHPYYEKYTGDPLRKQDTDRLEKRIEKFVASPSEHKPPIFLFEDRQHAAETISRLKRDNPDQVIYLVPTENSSGRPLFKISDEVYRDEKAWATTKGLFQHLGVQKILLGGMYHERKVGCVNEVADALKDSFQVEISSFAYPVARKRTYEM